MNNFRIGCVMLLCLSCSPSFAQEVMDDSDKAYGAEIAKEIAEALTGKAIDPYSAQIVKLRPSSGKAEVICGFVNLKNGLGAYTGFQPFYFTRKDRFIALQASSGCI